MLRKLIALGALSAALVAVPAGTAVAEPYTPLIPTQTQIEVVRAEPGKPVLLDVSASANYPTPPEGDIEVQISAASSTARGARAVAAAPLFTTTVHFVDDAVRVTGPVLPRGRYIASAALTPDNSGLFLPSDDTTAFRIRLGGGPGDEDDNDNGGLPNTGGPNVMWLLLGTGLLAAGAGGVGFGRRREVTTA
ncbi:hypothetical protein ASE01_23135 [Nocardioides sp. Root190]|nr:hypothetical protein ASE01_23135 [Nocardioides sp. Root190]